MKILFFILLFFFNIIKLYAQVEISIDSTSGEKITKVVERKFSSKGIAYPARFYKGSFFFYDNFEIGTFRIAGGKMYEAAILYNVLNDEIRVRFNGQDMLLQNANFTIGNHTFISINKHYYEQLYDGKIKLLKKYNYRIKELGRGNGGVYVGGYGGFDGVVIRENSYLFLLPENRLKAFKMTKKSIISSLGEENNSFSSYFKDDSLMINETSIKHFLENYF